MEKPVREKVNRALIKSLSKYLEVPRPNISIIRGLKQIVKITGIDINEDDVINLIRGKTYSRYLPIYRESTTRILINRIFNTVVS